MKTITFKTKKGTVYVSVASEDEVTDIVIKAESHDGKEKQELHLTKEAYFGVLMAYGYLTTKESLKGDK
jgi:hypothetical protein